VSAEQLADLHCQIAVARQELHEAQRIVVLLDSDDPGAAAGDAVAIARGIIERDLAARRVEAWTSILDSLRAEGRRLGLFS
jgi:hypothetical protein